MPVVIGVDKTGHYYKFGSKGKKYYYHDAKSMIKAKEKAKRQGRAIERSKALRRNGYR